MANAQVATLAKQLIAEYYRKPAAYSYFSGCSTGGREGMILSQRYPTVFNGIISGDPAMRTGLSNLAIGEMDSNSLQPGCPERCRQANRTSSQAITDHDRKLITDALLKQCDGKDGVADSVISIPSAVISIPLRWRAKTAKNESCLDPKKADAIKKAFDGPKTSGGNPGLSGFPVRHRNNGNIPPIRGLLAPGPGILVLRQQQRWKIDVEKEALADVQPLVDSMSTNLTTSLNTEASLIFYHGNSDPWFSPLDTFGYYKQMTVANGGSDTFKWSQFYFIPGMCHCGGGPALDQFDLLNAMVDWVEKGNAPTSVNTTGRAFPGRSRPLCPYPKHALYKGQGDTEDAKNFECR